MSGKFIYLPPRPHCCDLPYRETGLVSYDRCGARRECECGQRWIYLPLAWGCGWVPLRWWHRWTQPMKKEDNR